MPLINTTYTKTAIVNPINATGLTYTWFVDGIIISGQNTNNINYQFTSTGNKQVKLDIFNACSSASQIQLFNVCEPIAGAVILGGSTVSANDTGFYTYGAGTGSPASYTWSVDSSLGTITSGQGSNQIQVQFNNATTGSGLISVVTTDCDGNHQTTNITVTKTITCIAITSVSF